MQIKPIKQYMKIALILKMAILLIKVLYNKDF